MPELNTNNIVDATEKIKFLSKNVTSGTTTWQELFDTLPEGEKHFAQLGQQMEGQIITTEGVAKANQKAREATIAHNAALKQQTLGAKTATVATKALATAGNMIAFLLISKGIELAAVAIDNYINRVEKCKERVNDIVSTFNYAIDTANAHKNSINEIALRYNELSKGVDNLGQNVSLTTDEYSEYTAIANQIAEMFPSMVQGYTNEGNAILKLKGNVNALTDAYEAEAQAAYNSLIASGEDSNGNDIITDWKNSLSEDKGNGTNITQAIKELEAFITSDMDAEMYTALKEKASAGIYDGMTDAEKLISSSQLIPLKIKLDLNENGIITDEEFAVAKKSAKDLLHKYNTEIESDFSNTKLLANAYLMTNQDFKKLDEQSQAAASLLLNSIPATSDVAQVIMTGTNENIAEYVNFLVQALSSSNPEVKTALINLLTLDTENMTPDNLLTLVNSYIAIIADYLHQDENELKIQLRFEYVKKKKKQYQNTIDYTKNKFEGYNPANFFEKNSINTQEELDKWLQIAKVANTASDAEERYIQSSIVSFTDAFNSPEFTESAHALEELAKSGEITPEVLTSTEAYAELLKQTGLSADEATNKILDLLSSQEKLAGASNGLKQLQSSYEEFNELGFVTAATLESLPEVFKNLDGFDLFSKIVGDPTQGQEKIQQAFDDIVKQYLISQDTLSSLSNSSESEIQSYIANLKQMGITNAEEVVTQAMNVLSQDNQLLDEAETEYMMYLEHKDSADTEYLESLTIKNSELVSSLGKPYESDYNNWCELLTKKSEAYNEFVTRIGGSYNPELSAAENLQANGKEVNTFSLQEYYTYKAAYDQAVTDAQKMKDTLKLDLSTIDTNFNTNFSAGSSGSSTDSSTASDAKEEATETFDFIQNGLDLWERNMNRIKQVAENTYLSLTKRAKAYKDEIDGTAFGIQLLQKDYETYMAKANAVGLDENLAAAVRGGSSDITDITDDNVKQQIQDYESWYNKAQDCLDQIEELKIQLTELKLEKIQLEIDVKADKLTRLESALDKIQGKIDLKETWGFQASVKDYTKMNANLSKQMANLNEQNTLIKQQQKLVEKGSEAWQDYQQSIDSNNASIQSLTQSMAENASALAAIAGEKAASKIEKYDVSDELLQAKAENSNYYANQNSYVDSEIKNIGKRQSAYDAAVKTDKNGLKSASRSLTKTKATKGNKSLLKEIKSYVKSQKEIPSSVLTSAAQLDDNGSLYNKCVLYNAYLAAYETDKAAADLYRQTSRQEKADLASQKQANIAQYYENRQGVYTQRKNQIDAAINLTTAKGYGESAKYYQQLIKQEQNNNASLSEERQKLVNTLAKSVENGSVKRYSDEWYELCQQIDDVTNAINESDLALVEYQNQMRQLSWDNFDALQNKIKNITSETDFMANLLSNEDLSDSETGGLTDAGKATAYLHAANYQVYLQQAKDYENELAKIGTELAKDPYNENLISRKEELVSAYQESISAAQEEKYAIIDLYEQGYEAMSDKISDLISEYEALLDAEKNAYDYQNQISEKTEKIAQLRKQLTAYEGDLSEEARAKIQSISVSLNEAEKDLQDTQYDKYISDTKDLLSDLQSNFNDIIQDVVDAMSDNFGQLISNINAASTNSASLITDYMAEVGYTPTDVFSAILANKSVVEGTEEAITTTKELQAKMTAYANSIAASLSVLTAKDEVNQKIQSDGASALKADANSAASKADSLRDEYSAVTVQRTNAASKKKEAKEKYQTAKEKYGANHTKTRKALEAYNAAKANYSAINDHYLSLKENYNNARLKSEVMSFLSEHLGIASGSRSDLSDLNKALYDTYGMRVLDATEVKELAKLLDISSTNQSSTGDLYTKLKELGINGFRVGSKNVSYGQLAILAEGGKELQFDKSRGVLREVGQGDKIFTEEMTENLWRLAQMNPDLWNNRQIPITVKAPTFEVNTQAQPVSVAVGDIIMNGINDVETFGRQLREEICKNGKTTQCLTEAVASKIVHNGIGNARLYQ